MQTVWATVVNQSSYKSTVFQNAEWHCVITWSLLVTEVTPDVAWCAYLYDETFILGHKKFWSDAIPEPINDLYRSLWE